MTKDGKAKKYASRGQSNPDTIRKQFEYSFFAELAVSRLLSAYGVSKPTGYVEGHHQWRPDHTYEFKGQTGNIHVKSQNLQSSKRNGSAWMTGAGKYKDKYLMDEWTDDDFIALCLVDDEYVYIRAFLPVGTIHDLGLFTQEGISDYLKHSKQCIRLQMIEDIGIPRFQFPRGGHY